MKNEKTKNKKTKNKKTKNKILEIVFQINKIK